MQNGAQNGLVGDDFGTLLPETQIDQEQLATEKNMAKFSRTGEYQKLKSHLESRIRFYQQHLPDGRPLPEAADAQQRGNMWLIANAIIGEFTAVLATYEQASAVVEEAAKKNVR